MQEAPKDRKEFYDEFKDSTLGHARRRGVQIPTWDDILVVQARDWRTSRVWEERGVFTPEVETDIRYSLLFGRPGLPEGLSTPSTLFQQASRELLADIDAYNSMEDLFQDPDAEEVAEAFSKSLQNALAGIQGDLDNPHLLDKRVIKSRLLIEGLKAFTEHVGQGETDSYHRLAGKEMLVDFAHYMDDRNRSLLRDQNPIVILDSVVSAGVTPFRLVEITEEHVDPFLKYVLHRNGLTAPKDYEAPCRMPDPAIIDAGLEAFKFVETNRLDTVEPIHIVPDLLTDPEVLTIIRDLDKTENLSEKEEDSWFSWWGIRNSRNFIKLRNAVVEALVPPRGDEERFRHRPEISEELRVFLEKANGVVSKGVPQLAPARLMGLLIKDRKIRPILLKAGLTAPQLDGWGKALKERTKKREEEKKIKGKTLEDKVDDRELNHLLEKYAIDLSKQALEGKLDPVIGRQEEISQMIRILLQRGRSNPLLLGEPGVGKSVLFGGLATAIASGDAPASLVGARVLMLDLSAMNSGAMYRGQFEGILLPIIKGVVERNGRGTEPPILLCIDELHAALQAGSAMGTPGAGELLKPYLTKGELSIIGATTQADFARTIEPDAALTRRFQTVFIDEPKAEASVQILKGLKEKYATYHKLEIDDEMLDLIVSLTNRYLPNERQPDKGIRVLDASCARTRMAEKDSLTADWIYQTVAAEAKIDPEFLQVSDNLRFLRLPDELPQQVLGQDRATRRIAEALVRAKADLNDPRKPFGVFLLLGPTGVGKTETARALARLLHGTEDALIREDMSNYGELHEAAKLFGAPPGYVGFGEEGQLSGSVRRKPYSVVVLDELEKAHPDVMRRFLPVFEECEIKDGRGQTVSFRNTVILMTSNLGVREASQHLGFRTSKEGTYSEEVLDGIYEKAAKDVLSPELINRVDGIFIYHPLSREIIRQLVDREVGEISKRTLKRWGASFEIPIEVADTLAEEGYSDIYGARELKRTVNRRVGDTLAAWLLEKGDGLQKDAQITLSQDGDLLIPQLVTEIPIQRIQP